MTTSLSRVICSDFMGELAVAKKPYSPPKLVIIGSVRELTLGNRTGAGLDQAFPAKTPFNQLRFS